MGGCWGAGPGMMCSLACGFDRQVVACYRYIEQFFILSAIILMLYRIRRTDREGFFTVCNSTWLQWAIVAHYKSNTQCCSISNEGFKMFKMYMLSSLVLFPVLITTAPNSKVLPLCDTFVRARELRWDAWRSVLSSHSAGYWTLKITNPCCSCDIITFYEIVSVCTAREGAQNFIGVF